MSYTHALIKVSIAAASKQVQCETCVGMSRRHATSTIGRARARTNFVVSQINHSQAPQCIKSAFNIITHLL